MTIAIVSGRRAFPKITSCKPLKAPRRTSVSSRSGGERASCCLASPKLSQAVTLYPPAVSHISTKRRSARSSSTSSTHLPGVDAAIAKLLVSNQRSVVQHCRRASAAYRSPTTSRYLHEGVLYSFDRRSSERDGDSRRG